MVQAAPQAEQQQLIKSKSAKSIGHKRADSLISTKADEKVEEKTSELSSPATNHFKKRPKSVGGPQNYKKDDLLAEIKEMKDEHFETIDVSRP